MLRRTFALTAAVTLVVGACAASKPAVEPASRHPHPTPTTSSTSHPPSPLPRPKHTKAAAQGFSHVVVIVMENKAYRSIIGSPDAPYINSLAKSYGLAKSSFAIRHPSLPNYLSLIGGSTFRIHSDCTSCHVKATNLVDQLTAAGISWKAYMQNMPSPCFRGAFSGRYAKKHDPFMYFDDIAGSRRRCSHVVPYTQLGTDLKANTLPQFVWITPNLCNDMHDCPVSTGDAFLKGLVPKLLSAIGPNGALFLTWDEGVGTSGCCHGTAAGGHIATIVAGGSVIPHTRLGTNFDHYSVLRAIETAWELPLLRRAGCRCTKLMSAFFSNPI